MASASAPVFQTKRIEPKTSFLDLPFELREKIYGYALCTELWIAPEQVNDKSKLIASQHHIAAKPTKCCGRMQRLFVFPSARLLRVCRLIEYEASPFLYGNTFCFGDPSCFLCQQNTTPQNFYSILSFLSQLQERNRRLLTRVILGHVGLEMYGCYPEYNSKAASAIRLLAETCNLRSLDIRTFGWAAAKHIFLVPESDLAQELATLRGLEEFKISPWPETLEEYKEYYDSSIFASQAMTPEYKEDLYAVFRRYLDLKATMMKPKQQATAVTSVSLSAKRRATDSCESQDPELRMTKRAKSSYVDGR